MNCFLNDSFSIVFEWSSPCKAIITASALNDEEVEICFVGEIPSFLNYQGDVAASFSTRCYMYSLEAMVESLNDFSANKNAFWNFTTTIGDLRIKHRRGGSTRTGIDVTKVSYRHLVDSGEIASWSLFSLSLPGAVDVKTTREVVLKFLRMFGSSAAAP